MFKHKPIVAAIALTMSATIHADLTTGLVAYYPFTGNANDASGNNNNGTVNGATLTADRNGNANSAYSFNGSDDNITANIIGYNSISVSIWFYNVNQNKNYPNIFSLNNHSLWCEQLGPIYASHGTQGKINCISNVNSTEYSILSITNPDYNKWHHFAFTFDSGTKKELIY